MEGVEFRSRQRSSMPLSHCVSVCAAIVPVLSGTGRGHTLALLASS